MSSNQPTITSYAEAAAYLAAGKRSKVNRPHGTSRRIVAEFAGPGTISMIYHRTPVVTWLEDGRTVAWFNEHMTKTTYQHVEEYTALRAKGAYVEGKYTIVREALASLELTNRKRNGSGDGYALAVNTPSWPRTPSNIKRCRSCKGSGRSVYNSDNDCWNCDGGQKQHGNGLIPEENDGSLPILFGDGIARIITWGEVGLEVPGLYSCTCKLCKSGVSTWQEYYHNHQPYTPYSYSTAVEEVVGYSDSGDALGELLPGLKVHTHCPADHCTSFTGQISAVIIHLNDRHHWTRESIADWLETLDADLTFPTN